MKTAEMTRFDARLTKEQKEIFEYAAELTGSRSLTEFVISSAQKEADKIIEKNQFIMIRSKQDQQLFFETLVSSPKPNARLKKAMGKYQKMIAKNAG